ncbi:MAG: homoserine O-acetyltransferase [Balneolaceae bacterium]|nr:homoserine O-acetyltransferase [Balneolaceae bacterium]
MNEGITKVTLDDPFITESGFIFKRPEAAYKTWGKLNKEKNNVILICHALTGHAAADEWFPGIFGKGNVCDPEKNFIICINVPGSPYGSVGPWSVNPETEKPYLNDFPSLTVRDMVRFQQLVLDRLGIKGIELVLGGSLGGMQALEFSIMDPRIQSAVLMAMGKAHSAWAIGISHAQRTAIVNDPKWNGGNYNRKDGPDGGLAAARMMAMITYRTPKNYESRFGRNEQENKKDLFQVESYLNYQGKKLAERFDAHSYILLTEAMDTHDVSRERGTFEEVLKQVKIPVNVIGVDSDHLYPVYEQKELAKLLSNGEYSEVQSPYGHDAFLIEFEQLTKIIQTFTEKQHSYTLT